MPVLSRANPQEAIAWSIDGKAVVLDWANAKMTAPGGYDSMTGKVSSFHARHLFQGARVVGTRPNGKVLYQGLLASTPKIVNDVATIEAEGYQSRIRRRSSRLPYVIADASQWSQSNELPFDYANSEKYNLQSKKDGLGWVISNDTNYTASDRAGYGLYVPQHRVQRLKMTIRKSADDSNFQVDVRQADDLGSISSPVDTKALGAGTADGATFNVSAVTKNTVAVFLTATAGSPTAGTNMRVTLQNIRACVIAGDDDWTTSDVVSDVAGRMHFTDDVDSTGTLIGGLDWNGNWDGLLDYLADIEDWTWLVIEDTSKAKADAALTFRDWGHHSWMTNLDMAQENLTVAPLYNKVTVFYTTPGGVPQHKSYTPDDFGLDDPLDGDPYEYPDPIRLEDPQRNTNLADAIAEKLLRRVTQLRLVGSSKVMALEHGVPFDMQAGDTITMRGYNPKAGPQRIASVTYNNDGSADVSIERDYDIAAMLFKTTAKKFGAGHRK